MARFNLHVMLKLGGKTSCRQNRGQVCFYFTYYLYWVLNVMGISKSYLSYPLLLTLTDP